MRISTDKHEFGFLNDNIEGRFSGVEIKRRADFDDVLKKLNDHTHKDGYFYPPTIAEYRIDIDTGKQKEKLSNTRRPAAVFHMPASHTIRIESPVSIDDPTISDEALLIHSLAFLYGTRLQFVEWQLDGRVPIKKNNSLSFPNETAFHFLEHLYEWWKNLNTTVRTKVINIVYLHAKANSLEFEWEAFSMHYMVFDALFNVFSELNTVPSRIGHAKRIVFMCDHYGIAYERELIDEISNARNTLFHEAIWASTLLGFGYSGRYLHTFLGRLNERLICALAGYDNKFSRAPWHFMGWQSFDEFNS